MNDHKVFVIDKSGKPLMPTKRFGKVRKMLKNKMAKTKMIKPFTIQLNSDIGANEDPVQKLIMAIDPGYTIGITVRKENGEIVFASYLETRTSDVTKGMKERAMYRRLRRHHKRNKRKRRAKKAGTIFEGEREYKIPGVKEPMLCTMIKPKLVKFANRRRPEGWLTPTANHLLQSHKSFVKKIYSILPIDEIRVEYCPFDFQKLDNPKIKGKEYQNGRMKGCTNAQRYVLQRDKYTCQLCKKHTTKKNDIQVNVHHVYHAKGENGADTPENLVTLCKKCHNKLHRNKKLDAELKEKFGGMKKRYVHATILNTIMPRFYSWLKTTYPNVKETFGYETSDKRNDFVFEQKRSASKDHYIDAYFASMTWDEYDEIDFDKIDLDKVEVYRFIQFRRHTRNAVTSIRERSYKAKNDEGKYKIIAQNRKKRTGQTKPSLEEYIDKNGKDILPKFKVKKKDDKKKPDSDYIIYPGGPCMRDKDNPFIPGDIVLHKGEYRVLRGTSSYGKTVLFAGGKESGKAKDCKIICRNPGIVCV